MKGPPPNILERYGSATMRDHAAACHYDNLREHGIPEHHAREVANKAAEQQKRALDPASKAPLPTSATAKRNPHRVRFPWEPEDAGITLD